MKDPTTLDYIILGLIQQTPLTGYRIGKTFENTALGNFGGSPGTIYPALKRLENNAFIEKKVGSQNTSSNFAITSAGLKQLGIWLETLPSEEEIKKNVELLVLKFAFMDPLISRERKIDYLSVMKYELEKYLKELEQYFLKEKNRMPVNGKIAFEHGLMTYRTSIEWCDQAKDHLLESGG